MAYGLKACSCHPLSSSEYSMNIPCKCALKNLKKKKIGAFFIYLRFLENHVLRATVTRFNIKNKTKQNKTKRTKQKQKQKTTTNKKKHKTKKSPSFMKDFYRLLIA